MKRARSARGVWWEKGKRTRLTDPLLLQEGERKTKPGAVHRGKRSGGSSSSRTPSFSGQRSEAWEQSSRRPEEHVGGKERRKEKEGQLERDERIEGKQRVYGS